MRTVGGNENGRRERERGTTGSPKGVMLSHRNLGTMISMYLHHEATNIVSVLDPNWEYEKEKIILFLPFYHAYGFGLINISLLQGCTGIIFKSFEAHSFCRAIQDHKVSALRARIVLNGTCIVPDSCFDGALAGSKNKQKMLGCVLSEKNAKLSRYGAEVACSYNRMSVL
ncbi:unnamed protein product [Heligmosomoides polygyrus]|uniref:AMP-binding domain-containing protein n=1 Tax=Heligmosomoides polygyrus TaxID=6339 RepID=A0A183F7S2_HELPZ|nr:unnamed protein product [Heligmosomoides polygyrus]